ncbi:MAG: imidazole glycerol phosphate synthase subunit HisF [Elusimicrobia bacterium]|nr:imidazole glycerol phosphate synthase subunit HisF [Elusimicrobiota bacterium]
MLKKRLIPVLLLRNGVIVQSKGFKRYQSLGSPTAAVERLSSWAADELVYLDISPAPVYDLKRDDLNHPRFETIIDIIRLVAERCFMPLTFGGGIRSLDDIRQRLSAGADKVTLNTKAIDDPGFISAAAKEFGSQCVVVSIDAKRVEGGWEVYRGGRTPAGMAPAAWARRVQDLGAGEILLNSIDRDGSGTGYDLDLIGEVSGAVSLPLVALGGVGNWEHLEEGLRTRASAVAAANIFHYRENSVFDAKRHLYEKGHNVRKPLPLQGASRNL